MCQYRGAESAAGVEVFHLFFALVGILHLLFGHCVFAGVRLFSFFAATGQAGNGNHGCKAGQQGLVHDWFTPVKKNRVSQNQGLVLGIESKVI